jgi:hypothetical protein
VPLSVTPPTSVPSTVCDTPIRIVSSTLSGKNQNTTT